MSVSPAVVMYMKSRRVPGTRKIVSCLRGAGTQEEDALRETAGADLRRHACGAQAGSDVGPDLIVVFQILVDLALLDLCRERLQHRSKKHAWLPRDGSGGARSEPSRGFSGLW